MKNEHLIGMAICVLAANTTQAVVIINDLNEYGAGSTVNGTPFLDYNSSTTGSSPFYALPNQFGTLNPGTLTYASPSGVDIVAGDLVINQGNGAKDVIQFGNELNALNQLYSFVSFYGLISGSPAANPLPNGFVLSQNAVTLAQGISTSYTPSSLQPGYVSGYAVTYNFYTTVPEPASMAALAGAFALIPVGWSALRSRRSASRV